MFCRRSDERPVAIALLDRDLAAAVDATAILDDIAFLLSQSSVCSSGPKDAVIHSVSEFFALQGHEVFINTIIRDETRRKERSKRRRDVSKETIARATGKTIHPIGFSAAPSSPPLASLASLFMVRETWAVTIL